MRPVPGPSRCAPGARLITVAASLLLAACASPSASPEGSIGSRSGATSDCFFARSLRDWRPLDDSNLILFADGRRPYHVALVRPAFGLRSDVTIGVYDRDGRVCAFGGDAIVIDGAVSDRIPIRSMSRLTVAELDELYVRHGITQPVVIDTQEIEPGGAGDRSE